MGRPASLLLALAAVFAASQLVCPSQAKEHVVTLTASNFEEEIAKHDFIVVEFYAPWCGHCKQLAPEYEKAATQLAAEGSSIVLAKVDADAAENKPLASKFEVRGFPTLKIFRNKGASRPEEYNGPREASGIVAYVKKLSGPASVPLGSAAEVKELLENDPVLVVGVFDNLDGDEFKTFSRVAAARRSEWGFRHTTDASLLPAEHGAIVAPAVRVLKTFDEGFADTASFDEEALTAFVDSNSLPLIAEFSQNPKDRPFLQKVFESPKNKTLLFCSYSLSSAPEFRRAFTAEAKKRPEGLAFVMGEASINSHALEYFGLAEKDTPAILIHDPASDAKYFKTNIEPEEVSEFITAFLEGKVERKIKSEPIPETNNGPVTVLVADNFNQLVTESGKNVLIEFYAPWCGHCKSLEPIYEKVGQKFVNDPDVVIAKMDYTKNDLPTNKFTVKGFPTLYFLTSTGKILTYNGARTEDALVEFVELNKTSPEEAEASAEEAEAAEEAAAGKATGKEEL